MKTRGSCDKQWKRMLRMIAYIQYTRRRNSSSIIYLFFFSMILFLKLYNIVHILRERARAQEWACCVADYFLGCENSCLSDD